MTIESSLIRLGIAGLAVGWTVLMPGPRAAVAAGADDTFNLGSSPDPPTSVARYSIESEELTPVPYVVVPPPPPIPGLLGGAAGATALDPVPGNEYTPMGSATVSPSESDQVLRLVRVTVAPGGSLRLGQVGGSGLVVMESGWLEVTEGGDATRLMRAPGYESIAAHPYQGAITIDAGDQLTFESEATVVLSNRGETPAYVLTVSVAPKADGP
jgi:hypothetical protein